MTDSRRGSSSGMMLLANKTAMGSTSRRNSNERIKFPVVDSKIQRAGGNMFVEKEDVLEDMLDEEAIERTRTIRAGLYKKKYDENLNEHNYVPTSTSSNEISKQLLKERLALEAHQNDLAMKKNIQKQIQNTANKKEQTFTSLVSDIEDSMSFLDSIDKNMILMEETKKSKIRRQFEDWNTQVHGGIQVYLILFIT